MKRIPVYAQALNNIAPGTEWTLFDSADLSTLIWLDKTAPRPTDGEIRAEAQRIIAAG